MEHLLLFVAAFATIIQANTMPTGLAERSLKHLWQAKQRSISQPQRLFNFTGDFTSPTGVIALPIEWGLIPTTPFLYTYIAIGTPPQPFRVQLHLGWSGLAVRSTTCTSYGMWGTKEHCGIEGMVLPMVYNESASTSRKFLYESAVANCSGQILDGETHARLSTDVVHLTSSAVEGIVVGGINEFEFCDFIGMFFFDLFDGVMGIGPPRDQATFWSDDTEEKTPLLFPTLLRQLALGMDIQHNTMILRFPPNNETQGKLTIGEVAPKTDFAVPLKNCFHAGCKADWNFQLNGLQLHGNVPVNLSIYGRLAVTLAPVVTIALPSKIAQYVYGYIQVSPPETGVDEGKIDCSAREALPDITLKFEGHDWVLGWEDYTHKWVDPEDGREACWVTILDIPDDEIPYIGVELLRKYDVVFNLMETEVGFIRL